MGKRIVDIEVVDAEKRRIPSKHYVYVIVVRWSDGSCFKIYRRYSRFFDLQTVLLDSFPIEGGTLDPNKRIIPFLPGKIFFGRSHIKGVAMKRLSEINDYCQNLIALLPKISQCDHVLEFFEVEPDDLDPPVVDPNESKKGNSKEKKAENISKPKRLECFVAVAEYEAQAPGELALQPGMKVEVLEKNDIGWWFVNSEDEQGWVPSTFLEPGEGTETSEIPKALPGEEEMFVCIEDFHASSEDEISLEKGVAVSVIQKNLDGWWLVSYQGKEAFAPGTYLKKANNASRLSMMEKSRLSGVEIISSLHDVSTLISTDKKAQDKTKTDISVPDKPAFASAFVKQRSLERGGSLIPPPRQNSIKKMEPPTLSQKSPIYVTVEDFTDTVGDGISFKRGQKVLVLEKTTSGWWLVRLGQEEGWVPASYLESNSGRLDSSSVYELANSQQMNDPIDDDSGSDSDGEWYTEPDDMTDSSSISMPSNEGKSKRPLPEIPIECADYEPVDEIKNTSSRSLPPPPPPPLPSSKGNNTNQSNVQLPSSNSPKKVISSTVPKSGARDEKGIVSGGATDLASVLKAKFESRPGSNAPKMPDEDRNIKPSKAVLPALPSKPKKLQNEEEKTVSVPSSKDDQNKLKQFSKPPPPSKSKPFNAFQNLDKKPENFSSPNKCELPKVSLKPVATKEPNVPLKPVATKEPNVPLKPVATKEPNVPLKPVATKEPNVPLKPALTKEPNPPLKPGRNDVKNMAAVLGKSLNPQPSTVMAAGKVPVAPKPQIANKPKPSVPSKPPLATKPKPAVQPKGSQNVSNIASALNQKLNFNKSQISESSENSNASNSINNNSKNNNEKKIITPNQTQNASAVAAHGTQESKFFVALYDFVGEVNGELSLREGDNVEILEENGDWVFIQLGNDQGWAPASYLQEV